MQLVLMVVVVLVVWEGQVALVVMEQPMIIEQDQMLHMPVVVAVVQIPHLVQTQVVLVVLEVVVVTLITLGVQLHHLGKEIMAALVHQTLALMPLLAVEVVELAVQEGHPQLKTLVEMVEQDY